MININQPGYSCYSIWRVFWVREVFVLYIKMGNAPGFPEAPSPYLGGRRVSDKALPKTDNFEVRWQRFVESLDVTEEKMKLIEQLPPPRKMELVLNYVWSYFKFYSFLGIKCCEIFTPALC